MLTFFDVDQRGLDRFEVNALRKLAEAEKRAPVTLSGDELLRMIGRAVKDIKSSKASFALCIASELSKHSGLSFSPGVILMAATLCRNISQAEVWAYSLASKTRELHQPFTLELWNRLGPFSAPLAEAAEELTEQWVGLHCDPPTKSVH